MFQGAGRDEVKDRGRERIERGHPGARPEGWLLKIILCCGDIKIGSIKQSISYDNYYKIIIIYFDVV